MVRLEAVSLEELQTELEQFDDYRPIQRLMAAIIYKQGPSVPTIAEWFDVRVATVYAWFDRLEAAENVGEALYDQPRPGRPRKLHDEALNEVSKALGEAPRSVGYPDEEWTIELLSEYLETNFDVNYSDRHIRRLLNDLRNS